MQTPNHNQNVIVKHSMCSTQLLTYTLQGRNFDLSSY